MIAGTAIALIGIAGLLKKGNRNNINRKNVRKWRDVAMDYDTDQSFITDITSIPSEDDEEENLVFGYTGFVDDLSDINQQLVTLDEKNRKKMVEDSADDIENYYAREKLKDQKFQKMLDIVRDFIRERDLIVYGGMALNEALPEGDGPYDQFYDMSTEIPDYDFYSENALKDAQDLAEIFFNAGYLKTQARGGIHVGTYKVFADFEAIADITQMPSDLLRAIREDAVRESYGLLYAGPKFLRVDLHKQLSESAGNVSRWGKVYSRARRIMYHNPVAIECRTRSFQTREPSDTTKMAIERAIDFIKSNRYVIFGATTLSIYKELADEHDPQAFQKYGGYIYNGERRNSDLDVITYNEREGEESALKAAESLKTDLMLNGYKNIKVKENGMFIELFSNSYTVMVGDEAIVSFYQPNKCYNYYQLDNGLRLASFDSSLTLMFAKLFKTGGISNGRPDDKVMCLL